MHERDLDVRRLFVDTQARLSGPVESTSSWHGATSPSATWRLSIKPYFSIRRVASLGGAPDDHGPKDSADWSLAE
jgi:hypothetical protein